MAHDEDEDLYDEEFDFVDDDDEEGDDEEASAEDSELADEPDDERASANGDANGADEPVDEYGRTEPAANYVVHVYEHKKFTRTIDRPFTPEDAEAFATEFNRTSKNYGRFALSGKNDAKPKKALD